MRLLNTIIVGFLAYASTSFAQETIASTSTLTPRPYAPPPPPPLKYQSCGGFRVEPKPCPKGYICVDKPGSGCGMACDQPGLCVKPVFCGGFANIKCKDSRTVCVDDPRDDCDPKQGGADCGGICV